MFSWEPLVWLVRIVLALLLLIAILYLVHFLRPSNAWTLIRGKMPQLRRVEALGLKVEVAEATNAIRDDQIRKLQQQIDTLEEQFQAFLDIAGEEDDAPWKQ